MADDTGVSIVHNRKGNQFEATVAGQVAVAQYMLDRGTIYLTHTEVPADLRGRGIAQALARGAFAHARAEGLRVVALCPFMRQWVERHEEYASLLRAE